MSNNQRGGVLLIVAAALSALFGIAALAIDHGYNLSERRQLITATDAAALAAADAYGYGETGCDTVATDFLTRNATNAELISCEAFGDTTNGTYGWVSVSATLPVDQHFARMIGFDIVTVASTSTAVFGGPEATYSGGLRPTGLCLAGLSRTAEYQSWLSGDPNNASPVIRVMYNKDHPNDCGSTTGNWGFIDFDGGGNSNQDTVAWIRDGYDGSLTSGWYQADPGALSGSHRSALSSLIASAEVFWLPVFDSATGNGGTTEYFVSHALPARLVGYKVTGSQKNRYLEFVIEPRVLVEDVTCCGVAEAGERRITSLVWLDALGNPSEGTS